MTRTLLLVLALSAAAGVATAQPRPVAAPLAVPPAVGQSVSCPALLVVGTGSSRFKSAEDTPRPLSVSEVRPDGALICTYPLDLNGAAATLNFPGKCRASSEPGWVGPAGGPAICKGADCHAICR